MMNSLLTDNISYCCE